MLGSDVLVMKLTERFTQSDEPDPLKGLLAGLAGGFVGTLAMTAAQAAMTKIMASNSSNGGEKNNGQADKPSTEKVADAVAENVFDHDLSEREEKIAGQVVHYGFGTAMGGLYGVVCEYIPTEVLGGGAPFGTAVMLGADEIAVPALKLSDPPWKHPASTHMYAFVSHLVYGVTTEVVRRNLRAML
jgi:putative membrane protein